MTEGEGIRVEMTRFHNGLLAHNHEGTRAVGRRWCGVGPFIGCVHWLWACEHCHWGEGVGERENSRRKVCSSPCVTA